MVLGTKAGVDPELIFEAIKGGLAGSTVMNAKTPMIINRNLSPDLKSICILKISQMRWIHPVN